MKKIYILTVLAIIVGCGGNATVEFGMNDEAIMRGEAGSLAIWVAKIEMPEDDTYSAVWEGSKQVNVEIGGSTFASITDAEIEIVPGSYNSARLTVDSIYYVEGVVNAVVVDTALQFVANALTTIVIEENDQLSLVVNIASTTWFDSGTQQIISGHNPFEGARLRIHY